MNPLDILLAHGMPPYMCKCGRAMGGKWATVDGRWTEVEPGCQPGNCLCPHRSVYDCAGCNEQRCMQCDEPAEREEVKTAVRWCPQCKLAGKHIGLVP